MARRVTHPPLAASKAPKASRKKQAKIERMQRQKEPAALVASANAEVDLIGGLELERMFRTAEGAVVDIKAVHGPQLSSAELDDCIGVLASNMRKMYEDSGWGWDEKAKREGLVAGDSRVLLLSAAQIGEFAPNGVGSDDADGWVLVDHPSGDQKATTCAPPAQPFTAKGKQEDNSPGLAERVGASGGLLGFVHLQFCIENENPVLYVLELQLAEEARSIGLGKHMMTLVESIARKHKMSGLMLTVFKHNPRALSFYLDKLRYDVDETSPSQCGAADSSYEILSKRLSEAATP